MMRNDPRAVSICSESVRLASRHFDKENPLHRGRFTVATVRLKVQGSAFDHALFSKAVVSILKVVQ